MNHENIKISIDKIKKENCYANDAPKIYISILSKYNNSILPAIRNIKVMQVNSTTDWLAESAKHISLAKSTQMQELSCPYMIGEK